MAQSRGKTVIMITHRMANAEHADQVVVLEHGKSVERGTHTELMTRTRLRQAVYHAGRY